MLKGSEETLQAILLGLDKSNKEFYFKNVSGQEDAWCWYPRVAVNSDGLIMVTWMMSQQQTYFYRLYDSVTDKWTEVKALIVGPMTPLAVHVQQAPGPGPDFFWIGLNGGPDPVALQVRRRKGRLGQARGRLRAAASMWFSAATAPTAS